MKKIIKIALISFLVINTTSCSKNTVKTISTIANLLSIFQFVFGSKSEQKAQQTPTTSEPTIEPTPEYTQTPEAIVEPTPEYTQTPEPESTEIVEETQTAETIIEPQDNSINQKTTSFKVRVGSFSSYSDAEETSKELETFGYTVFIVEDIDGNYIQLGSFLEQDKALTLAEEVSQKGYSTIIRQVEE